jgi:hypothetical protein
MSLAQIKPVVEKFILDDHNDLLVIKGGWGVGKTYFWQDMIRKAVDRAGGSNQIGRRFYAYVSLFGVNSLEELKNSILAARVDSKAAGTEDGISAFISGLKQLVKGAENVPALREWTGGMAGTALFLLLKDTLICFDDIERKGDGLATKDLLGLASLLKEQRNCKIAFILNDGSMEDEEKENFRRHGEKIIDLELRFSPLPEEAFDYAFPESHPYYDFIKSCCLTLQIKNIRILQRINRFAENLLPYLEGSESTVVEDALRSLTLYVWCYYDRDSGAPPLSYVVSYSYVMIYIREKYKDEGKPSAQEKQWSDLLQRYGYRNTDEVDQFIASFVETGYLDEAAFSPELEKKNVTARAQKGEHSYMKAWDLYGNSFNNNEEDFVRELAASFRANIMYLSIRNLQNTVDMLRDLQREELADALIGEYFDQHAGDSHLINVRHSAFLNEIKDTRLNDRLRALWQTATDERTLAEVVKELTGQNGWNTEDIELLASHSTDDYYDFFKSENSDSLYLYVRTCLRFGEIGNADEQYREIAGKAKEALRRLASENRLNRIRVTAMYKIELDDSPPETSPDASTANKAGSSGV